MLSINHIGLLGCTLRADGVVYMFSHTDLATADIIADAARFSHTVRSDVEEEEANCAGIMPDTLCSSSRCCM